MEFLLFTALITSFGGIKCLPCQYFEESTDLLLMHKNFFKMYLNNESWECLVTGLWLYMLQPLALNDGHEYFILL